jgi:hypothetical protein
MTDLFTALHIKTLAGPLGPGSGAQTGDGEPVVVSGPTDAPSLIITGRDPVSTDYFASTLITMLTTFPSKVQREQKRSVVVFGGDEPWRYGMPYEKVARHTDIATKLTSTELPFSAIATADEFALSTYLTTTLPTSPSFTNAIIYFRMNSVPSQTDLDAKLVTYVQAGGALLVLHHGLYNESGKKTGLMNLTGGEIPSSITATEMLYPGPNRLLNTNLGHFATTYKLQPETVVTYTDTTSPSSIGRINNVSNSYLSFSITPDELITSLSLSPSAQATPLFANDYAINGDANRTVAWVRSYGNGKVAFYEPGERNDTALANESWQAIINLLLYLTKDQPIAQATPVVTPGSGYKAQWVSQTQGTLSVPGQSFKAFALNPGQSTSLTTQFKNVGSTTWYSDQLRNDFVGFYVYKDPIYSTPLERNDPTNSLFGTSYFANSTWGTNFVKTQQFTRAAVLKETSVTPGSLGTFEFTFTAPSNAVLNDQFDNPYTPHSEYYYREDLTLATGPNWMQANCAYGQGTSCTGDPLGLSHIWFAIRIQN